MNDDNATTFQHGADGQVFVRLLDGATTDERLEGLITASVNEAMSDLATQLDDDSDINDWQAARILARARPMAERVTRTNLYAMRAKLRH